MKAALEAYDVLLMERLEQRTPTIDHFIYFESRAGAQKAAKKLKSLNVRELVVTIARSDDEWLLRVAHALEPDVQATGAFRQSPPNVRPNRRRCR